MKYYMVELIHEMTGCAGGEYYTESYVKNVRVDDLKGLIDIIDQCKGYVRSGNGGFGMSLGGDEYKIKSIEKVKVNPDGSRLVKTKDVKKMIAKAEAIRWK